MTVNSWLVLAAFVFLYIPIVAFGQSNNILLDSRSHYGEILIKNVKVTEKEFYKVIVLDTQIKVKDLELEHLVSIYPDSIKLVNENGKVYFPTREECTIPEPLVKVPDGGPCYDVKNECGKPSWDFTIKGTEGGIKSYHPCFRVEKEFNDFKVYYGYEKSGKSISNSYQIESIDLNQMDQQKPLANTVYDTKISTKDQSKDFLTQLVDMLKKLFGFS